MSGGCTRREFIAATSAGLAAAVPAPTVRAQSPPSSLPALTIADAARQIAARKLSPVELTGAILQRIERLDSKVGAFITVAAERAMAAARAAEREIHRGRYLGPLHGIPVGVKDTYYTRGIRTTAGARALQRFVPDFDCAVVEKLTAAGAIVVGKTNLPEFSFGGYTPGCHNPWDLSRNAGGSSGGSAAALAAGFLLGACGGDTSGSIRNPASHCAVVGHKPTYGLVSRYGVVPISWSLDHLGPMARTVEDAAILLTAIAGYDPRDRYSAKSASEDYRRGLRGGLKGVRVGVIAPGHIDRFEAQTKAAFYAAVKAFERLGARLREVAFPEWMRAGDAIQRVIRISEAAAYHRRFLAGPQRDLYYQEGEREGPAGPSVRTSVEAGSLLTAAQYLQAQRARAVFTRDMATIYEDCDVLLSPSMPAPAGMTSDSPQTYRTWWNVSGFPALSLPCGFTSDPPGLPIGLHISGAPFRDARVLAAAWAYEAATDWHKRQPPL